MLGVCHSGLRLLHAKPGKASDRCPARRKDGPLRCFDPNAIFGPVEDQSHGPPTSKWPIRDRLDRITLRVPRAEFASQRLLELSFKAQQAAYRSWLSMPRGRGGIPKNKTIERSVGENRWAFFCKLRKLRGALPSRQTRPSARILASALAVVETASWYPRSKGKRKTLTFGTCSSRCGGRRCLP